ncbi:TPA: di-trans,poly-cis-decaprenylcistransferase [bacterium]|nr:di-trans,poly-cis-decaprenylcistransferase [bacterium]
MSAIKHVAIILDGNRRYAKKRSLEPWKGHDFGAEKVEKLLEWCEEFNIHELTLYTFSIQNFQRPKEEVDYLLGVVKRTAKKFMEDPRIMEKGVRINIVGRYELFPNDVIEICDQVMLKTRNNSNYTLNLAFGYGGREEIIDAVKKIVAKNPVPEEINEEYFANNLYLNSDPDLVVRTGGAMRTSNFLPWQTIYSEWFFLEKTWPEIEKEDFKAVLDEFNERERRFGK